MIYYKEKDKKYYCSIDPDHEVIVSFPPSVKHSYCRTCVQIQKENAPACPHCGTKIGFAWGTGDCGCEVDDY